MREGDDDRRGGIACASAAAFVTGADLQAPEPWPRLAMVLTYPQAGVIGAHRDPDAAEQIIGGMDSGSGARPYRRREARARCRASRQPLGLCDRGGGDGAGYARPADHRPSVEEGLATALSEIGHKTR